jgi:hypothetical protein
VTPETVDRVRIRWELPVGRHPLQLYSLATPNGVKVTVMLEEPLPRKILGRDYAVSNRPGDLTALCPGLNYHLCINSLGDDDAQATRF